MKELKVALIGGGSGTRIIIYGILKMLNVILNVVVTATDSGGSTGVLLKHKGLRCIGDWTKCMCSIARMIGNQDLADVIEERLEFVSDKHSLKNLLFYKLEKKLGIERAIEMFGEMLNIGKHRVFPATIEDTDLCAEINNLDNDVVGETNIDLISYQPWWRSSDHWIKRIYLSKKVNAYRPAVNVLRQADIIVISQGDLYTSVGAILLLLQIIEAIQQNKKAKIVLFLNLMTKKGETDRYKLSDFVRIIEKWLGREIDHIVYSTTQLPVEILETHRHVHKEEPVKIDYPDPRLIGAPLACVNEKGEIITDATAVKEAFEKVVSIIKNGGKK